MTARLAPAFSLVRHEFDYAAGFAAGIDLTRRVGGLELAAIRRAWDSARHNAYQHPYADGLLRALRAVDSAEICGECHGNVFHLTHKNADNPWRDTDEYAHECGAVLWSLRCRP